MTNSSSFLILICQNLLIHKNLIKIRKYVLLAILILICFQRCMPTAVAIGSVRHISTVLGPRPSIFLRLQLHALSTFPINWHINRRAGCLPTKLRPPYCSRCGHASWIPTDRMLDSHQRTTSLWGSTHRYRRWTLSSEIYHLWTGNCTFSITLQGTQSICWFW